MSRAGCSGWDDILSGWEEEIARFWMRGAEGVLELELADRCVDIIDIRAEGFIFVAREEGLLPL